MSRGSQHQSEGKPKDHFEGDGFSAYCAQNNHLRGFCGNNNIMMVGKMEKIEIVAVNEKRIYKYRKVEK